LTQPNLASKTAAFYGKILIKTVGSGQKIACFFVNLCPRKKKRMMEAEIKIHNANTAATRSKIYQKKFT
jgi:hypothetical protein